MLRLTTAEFQDFSLKNGDSDLYSFCGFQDKNGVSYWEVDDRPWRVYFIQSNCPNGHIKIGRAKDVESRLRGLQTGLPYPARLMKSVIGGPSLEKEIQGNSQTFRTS